MHVDAQTPSATVRERLSRMSHAATGRKCNFIAAKYWRYMRRTTPDRIRPYAGRIDAPTDGPRTTISRRSQAVCNPMI
jgi:hypothetical protein